MHEIRISQWRSWFVALVAWGAWSVPANADRRVIAGATPVDGPVLAGASVVYTEEDGTGLALWQAAPGAPERRIEVLFSNEPATDEFAPATIDALTDLDASPLRVATGISRSVTKAGIMGAQISSAPPGRVPVGLVTTGDGAQDGPRSCGDLTSGTVGVDAEAVGYASDISSCAFPITGRRYAVRVRDFATPGEPAEGPRGCRGSVRLTIGSGSVRRAFDGTGRVRVRLALRARDLRSLDRSRKLVGRLRVRQELPGERVSTRADRRVTIRG